MTQQRKYQFLFQIANTVLWTSLVISLISIIVAYPYASHFSLKQQIFAHILIIVAATLVKIGYVSHMAVQKELGIPVQ